MDIRRLLSLPDLRIEVERVGEALLQSVATDDPVLTEVAQHLIIAGGKAVRPTLALAAALTTLPAPVPEAVVQGAAAVELVHLGSLYHDDVIDEAETRRAVPSVNARWGNVMAIIAGDFLLARSSTIAAGLGTEVTALLASTIADLCQGQVREHRLLYAVDRTVADYEACIAGKTASLVAASSRIGALTSGAPTSEVDAFTTFGHAFGMAFQIRDDVLDVTGTDEQLGKPAGHDLVEGVYTLPVLHALAEGHRSGDSRLAELLGEPLEPQACADALAVVRASSGVGLAVEAGRSWANAGAVALEVVRPSEMRDHLAALARSLFDELPGDGADFFPTSGKAPAAGTT